MFQSLPQDIQHICNRYVQELHKQDVLNEIQSINIIEFHYKKRLGYFIYEQYDFVISTISMEEFITSDNKVKFIREYLYNVGELDEDTYFFYFPYNKDKEEVIYLLDFWRPNDEDIVDEKDYYYQFMLNNMFNRYILEKIVDMLLQDITMFLQVLTSS